MLGAWGLNLAGIFFMSLVLDAWSLMLGAWISSCLKLDAWSLRLDAAALQILSATEV